MFFVHTFAVEVQRNVYKSGKRNVAGDVSVFKKLRSAKKFSIQTKTQCRYFKLKSYSSTLKRVRSRWTIYAVGLNVRIK